MFHLFTKQQQQQEMENWELFQPTTKTKTTTKSTDDHKALFQTKKENFVEFSNALKRVVVERINKVEICIFFVPKNQKRLCIAL